MKIPIWGSYNNGNFGDDLMAILYSNYLTQLGHKPIVFRLSQCIAEKYCIEIAETVEDLLSYSKFCILGGGAFLYKESLLRKILRKNTRAFEKDCSLFYLALKQKGVALYPVSIGGDGSSFSSGLMFGRKKLFSKNICQSASVRLPSDVFLLKSLGVKAKFYPDVLLGAGAFYGIEKQENNTGKVRVGLNIPSNTSRSTIDEINEFIGNSSGIEFYFITSHLPEAGFSYEYTPRFFCENVKLYEYSDPLDMVRFLSSLDVLFSFKLHLGVVALSCHVPFISIGGKKKTKAFLDSSLLQEYYVDNEISSCIKNVLSDICEGDYFDKYSTFFASDSAMKSKGHLRFLSKIVQEYNK